MISRKNDDFLKLKSIIEKERRIAKDITSLFNDLSKKENKSEKAQVEEHINYLGKLLKETNSGIPRILSGIFPMRPYPLSKQKVYVSPFEKESKEKQEPKENFELTELEKETIKRIKGKEKEVLKRYEKKPSTYLRIANRIFSNVAENIINKGYFHKIEKDIIKANMQVLLKGYVSMMFLTTIISFFVGIFTFLFFLFFNVGVKLPIITLSTQVFEIRFLETFWILFAMPAATFVFMYFYPALERDSVAKKINQELPFATIHMAAISGSMIDPTKIFTIIVSTGEYPSLEKEFAKLMNSINVLGYDLVSVLRNTNTNTASKKLIELYSGLATTISSGGDLPKFFDERSDSLLFEYNLQKEKNTRTAETLMDIYISVVIAAPMILMLLLMMMRISGLGIPLSTSVISLIMILSVSVVNVVFLVFLQIKQSGSET